MMSRAAIRSGRAGDLSAISRLLDNAGLPSADLACAHDFQTWILEQDGTLLGAVGLERFGSDALLRSLVVAPEHRKRGLAQELVACLEYDAKEAGVQRLVLLTETAENFFRRLGYSITDRSLVSDSVKQSAEFRTLCPASAVCMLKTLS
jgi:N-acetylglutamate synthase-like GNAT family acetyltransferase